MHKIVFISFYILLIILLPIFIFSYTEIIDNGELNLSVYKNYTKIRIEKFHIFGGYGEPELPYRDLIIRTDNADFAGTFKCHILDSIVYKNIKLFPAQRALPISSKKTGTGFLYNDSSYNIDGYLPDDLIEMKGIGKIRGKRYAKIIFSPFRYYPKENKLIYYKTLELESPEEFNIISNFKERANSDKGILYITDNIYKNALDTLLLLKKIEGYNPIIRTTQFIYNNYSGNNNPDKIRNYIKTLVDSGILYIVLAGDVNTIPTRYAFAMESGSGSWQDNIPTDYYYGDIDGNWNANGNLVYGEIEDSIDMLPDFYIGRLSFNSIAELNDIINKIYIFEKGDYSIPNCKILSNAGILDPYTDASVGLDTILSYVPDYFQKSVLYDNSTNNVYLGEFMDSLNGGFNYLIHSNHGSTQGFSIGQDFFHNNDADILNNVNNIPNVTYTISCISAAYDKDCMGEHFLRSTNGGGYYIGNARYGWYIGYYSGASASDIMQKSFFEDLFNDDEYTIGELISLTRLKYAPSASMENCYRWMEYNLVLMGDPSSYMRTKPLKNFIVNYDSIISTGLNNIEVEVRDENIPIEGAIITVFKSDSLIVKGFTDISGKTLLPLLSEGNDTLNINVFKNNFRLYSSKLFPGNKELQYFGSYIVDDNDSNFNPGETDTIAIIVKNYSDSTFYNLNFILNCNDSFVSINDTLIFISQIDPSMLDTLYYEISISDTVPYDYLFYTYFEYNGEILKDSIPSVVLKGKTEICQKSYSIGTIPVSVGLTVKNTGNGYIESEYLHFIPVDNEITVTPDSILIENLYPEDSIYLYLNIDTTSLVNENSILKVFIPEHNDTIYFIYNWNNFYENVSNLNPPGWEMYGMGHVSSTRYYSPFYSFHFGYPGDSLGYYANDSIISPWIISTGEMTMKYSTWYNLQAGYDFAIVFIGRNNDWSILDSYSGVTSNWIEKQYLINKVPPGDSFKLKFVISSYNKTGYEGWYFDDIKLFSSDITGIEKIPVRRNNIEVFKIVNRIARNDVNLIIAGNFKVNNISIYSVSGRKLTLKNMTDNGDYISIDIKHFRKGLYIIRYKNKFEKFIKI